MDVGQIKVDALASAEFFFVRFFKARNANIISLTVVRILVNDRLIHFSHIPQHMRCHFPGVFPERTRLNEEARIFEQFFLQNGICLGRKLLDEHGRFVGGVIPCLFQAFF